MEGPIHHEPRQEMKQPDMSLDKPHNPGDESDVDPNNDVEPDDDAEIDSELRELRNMGYDTDIKPYQPEMGRDAGVSQQPELRLPVDDAPFDQEKQDDWERQRNNPDDPESAQRGVDTWEMSGESEDRN